MTKTTIDYKKFTPEQHEIMQNAIAKKVEVLDNGCMVWNGSLAHGSPIIQVRTADGGRSFAMVKRYVLQHADPSIDLSRKGRIFSTCGNKRCVNPNHLKRVNTDMTRAVEVIAWIKQNLVRYRSNYAMGKAYGFSGHTMGKYRKMYLEDPDMWDKLIEGYLNAKG